MSLTLPDGISASDQPELESAVKVAFLNPTAGDGDLLLPH